MFVLRNLAKKLKAEIQVTIYKDWPYLKTFLQL